MEVSNTERRKMLGMPNGGEGGLKDAFHATGSRVTYVLAPKGG